MRTLTALCLASLLSGCIPIGVRGSTMPLRSAVDSMMRGVLHAGPGDRWLAWTRREAGPAVSLRQIAVETLPA